MSAIVEDMDSDDAPEVRRFAIKYHPPTIVIEYRKSHKLYIKKIKLKLHSNVDANKIVTRLIAQNKDLLHESKICRDQLLELVNLLVGIAPAKDTQKTGTNYTSTSTMTSKDPTHEEKSNTTINVPPVVEVNTNREDLSAGEDDAWFNDLIADSSPQELPSMNNSSTKKKISFENGHDGSSNTHVNFSPKPYNREDRHDDPSELNDLNNIDKDSYYAVVDLNKAPQVLVEKAKEHMNVCFEKNRVLSTDANYVYDKQVEFTAPVESNDWDDED